MAGEAGGRLMAACSQPPSRAASSRYLPVWHRSRSALSANSGGGCLGEPSANARAGRKGPRGTAAALCRGSWRCQRQDGPALQRGHGTSGGARALPARRCRQEPAPRSRHPLGGAACRHVAAGHERSGVSPYPEAGTHDRGFGRRGGDQNASSSGGDSISAASASDRQVRGCHP